MEIFTKYLPLVHNLKKKKKTKQKQKIKLTYTTKQLTFKHLQVCNNKLSINNNLQQFINNSSLNNAINFNTKPQESRFEE